MEEITRIYSALLNREVSHSAFRLYGALVAMLGGESRPEFTPVSIAGLGSVVPGVRGKQISETTLRDNVRELQYAGLVATRQASRPKDFLLVKLLNHGLVPPENLREPLVYELDEDDLHS
jgi:hypothetical protein